MNRRHLLQLLAASGLAQALPGRAGTPPLAAADPAGIPAEIPAAALANDRLPRLPLVVDLPAIGRETGRPGGNLRTFITNARDVRYMVVWGYARLVGYDSDYNIVPDILLKVEAENDSVFTLHLRPGHRWSDGHPFTTEDFRYWWEDVARNRTLSPGGVPELMQVDGELPEVTVIDETRIRYAWRRPNPRFLPALAAARPPFIYRPSHYMRRYHASYTPEDSLVPMIYARNARNWAQLHNDLDDMYKNDNPDLPTLQPWVTSSAKNSQGYTLRRNPYYHRCDQLGQQLPYIDSVELVIAAGALIPQKVSMGEADLQVRSLNFGNAPVLKQGEEKGNYHTRLWTTGAASEIALYPNQNYQDPGFRNLFRNADFRRALSLGVRRKTINKTLYFGLAREVNVAPLLGSPFYSPDLSLAWASHSPDMANRILDGLGLRVRDSDGTRRMQDGRRLEIVIESAGERPAEADAVELLTEMWAEIGVRVIYRPLDRDILRNRAYAGLSMMPVWTGWSNGLPTADTPPTALAPVDQTNFAWPMWGQYFQTMGTAGEPPDTRPARKLRDLFTEWGGSGSADRRARIWEEMLRINAWEVFSIGLVSATPQPAIVSKRLRNVPEKAVYSWEPGAQLGVMRMDEFWFAD